MLLEKQQQKEEHLLVKKYLKDHSLVESNITSFNNFIDHRMQEIIQELNETMPSEDIEISLGKIKVDSISSSTSFLETESILEILLILSS